ncbi:arginine--tRNA ligase [Infirmifilum lucidum]|uniref:Arginine--tRNA ligase n=1 Tax=Infirmifilum lucidum TaxID=2776706 RepID=A0A7L9FEH6_9CREN|nr:arginine--tRNA ligase [Infirmifilum lucidum]QOJ78200.1 arginine--tRNA ligase [Infirmifilum lucidum]
MSVVSPSDYLKERVREYLARVAEVAGLSLDLSAVEVRRPLRQYGDVSVPLFKLYKEAGLPAETIRERISRVLGSVGHSMLTPRGIVNDYLNLEVNIREYAPVVIDSILSLGVRYGSVPSEEEERIIVEFVSANPIHPLHVGHLRNAVLGEALVRLLKSRGHDVRSHFYVDDVGLQVAYAVYGFKHVKEAQGKEKPDHFVGAVYTMVNLLVEVRKLKESVSRENDPKRIAELNSKIDEYVARLKDYSEKYPDVFNKLADVIMHSADPEGEIRAINRGYEEGGPWAVKLTRETINTCLEGIKQTLERLGVAFDSWDWESEITVWSGATEEVVEKLAETGLVEKRDGALVFRADLLAESNEVREAAAIPPGFSVTPLTLKRSDGTTLYTTRDIAYSIWKLARADKVINVIATQQSLAQAQLRLALYALGYRDIGRRLVHYAYEMVVLPGVRMTSRKGVYVSADEILQEAVDRAREEIRKRGLGSEKDAEKIGVGALKFFFLSQTPSRTITFSWERVLDFEQNSGPFVQYSYVRALSILRKAEEQGIASAKGDPSLLGEEEKPVVLLLGEFPSVVRSAAESLRPDLVTSYLNNLAVEFNKYYDTTPVLKAPEGKREARLMLVKSVAQTLANGMYLLGIEPPERM